MNTLVNILLATYNSARFIKPQLDSLFAQTYQDFVIYVRDDGSSDTTIAILEQYMDRYSEKIILLERGRKNIGPAQSFLLLLEKTRGSYYMFCDHDDVWLPHKIKDSLFLMLEVEKKYGKHIPILVHSDMIVVDESLKQIAPSFWRYIKVNPKYNSFHCLSSCNNVNGCTILINNVAKNVSLINSEHAIMHDVWIALSVAYNNGVIKYVNQPLMLYRQHSQNVLGANQIDSIKNKIIHLKDTLQKNKRYFQMLNYVGRINFITYMFCKIKMAIIRRCII